MYIPSCFVTMKLKKAVGRIELSKCKEVNKKPFEELTITDNYMFTTVMCKAERVKPLLEMVLNKKIKKVVFVEAEKTQETGYRSRGIRCDVYIEDEENTVYDVEMQASKKRHLGKRFRYYQSAIDVGIVSKGENVDKLKTSYIIFITTYDPFDKGLYVYPFDTICTWDPSIVMNDAATWYILNTTGTKDAKGHEVSEEIKEMLAYMNGSAPESDYAKMLDEAVKDVKRSEERRLEYMSINANVGDEREIGDYRTYVNQIRGNDGLLTDEQMLAFMHIDKKTLDDIRLVISQHPDWDDDDVAEEVLDMSDKAYV